MTGQSIGKIYGPMRAPKIMKAQIIAEINGFELETTPEFEMGKDNKSEEYLAKFPMGQVPSFEASNGFCLAESGAIALYIAELKKDTTLFGKTPEDRAKVMQFIFNAETQVDKHASTILYQNLGYLKKDEDMAKLAYTYLDRNLEYYNNLLSKSDYLVANQLTLADISFFFGFYYPYVKYIDEERKSKFANVTKFMDRLSKDEKFAKVLVNAV